MHCNTEFTLFLLKFRNIAGIRNIEFFIRKCASWVGNNFLLIIRWLFCMTGPLLNEERGWLLCQLWMVFHTRLHEYLSIFVAQFLVRLKRHCIWQAQHLVTLKSVSRGHEAGVSILRGETWQRGEGPFFYCWSRTYFVVSEWTSYHGVDFLPLEEHFAMWKSKQGVLLGSLPHQTHVFMGGTILGGALPQGSSPAPQTSRPELLCIAEPKTTDRCMYFTPALQSAILTEPKTKPCQSSAIHYSSTQSSYKPLLRPKQHYSSTTWDAPQNSTPALLHTNVLPQYYLVLQRTLQQAFVLKICYKEPLQCYPRTTNILQSTAPALFSATNSCSSTTKNHSSSTKYYSTTIPLQHCKVLLGQKQKQNEAHAAAPY